MTPKAAKVNWPRVTREVADDLAVDASARDQAGKPPLDEVARLREAGLLSLLTAPGPGSRGTDWSTGCAVIREIAAADGSVGELVGRHYALSWSGRFFGTADTAERLEKKAVARQWLWGGALDLPEADPGLALTPADDGYLLHGRETLGAGVGVADRLILGATLDSGDVLVVQVDPAHPGVTADRPAERYGQRLVGGGSVEFDAVPVARAELIGALPRDEHAVPPAATLASLAIRLVLVHTALGIAEGALAEARDLLRSAPGSWQPAGEDGEESVVRPSHDPYVLLAYGELATLERSAAAVVDQATRALAHGLSAGQELGVEERGDIAVHVAVAEAVSAEAATGITTRLLELTAGAEAAAPTGLDRFWRNARMVTARQPAARRLRDIGDHYLNGTHPRLAFPV
ncbi:acyl-CoA dehydrogenase [Streptomyces sp. AcH 505]|uniref:acyl-CoA dehydrogenase family protein n=1 Tax=Streptomyces sp. AcH 505 TaxID=352211 RepID=UPI000591BC86|nr:acyl-CoA dehydrogenase [Streptomyces sp. AcH 505]